MIVLALVTGLLAWGSPPVPGKPWREVSYRGRTAYTVVADPGGVRLRAESRGRNSALFHPLPPHTRVRSLAWRWRVLRHPGGADTRVRRGDDRAAAVFVLVRRSWLPWRTRGLMYQWSPSVPRGDRSPSPYAGQIHVITLRDEPADTTWFDETRDVESDLREAFGELPASVEAIGVLCDSDDTGDRAAAEFGEIAWEGDTGAAR
jgi:hypothetical protein